MFLKDKDMLSIVALIVLMVLLSKLAAAELIYELPGTYTAADTSFKIDQDMVVRDYVFWLNVRDYKKVIPFSTIIDAASNKSQGILIDNREISTLLRYLDTAPAGYGEKMYLFRKYSGGTKLFTVRSGGDLDTVFDWLGGSVYIKRLKIFMNSDVSSNTTLRDLKMFSSYLTKAEIDSLRNPPVQVLRVSRPRAKVSTEYQARMFTVNGRLVNTRLNLPNDWGFYVISSHNHASVANHRLFTRIVGD